MDFETIFEDYQSTATIQEYEAYEQEIRVKIEQLKRIMGSLDDNQARRMIESQRNPEDFNPIYLRPDKYTKQVKKNFATQVQETIPADILTEFSLIKEERTLAALPLIKKYPWLASDQKLDNSGLIARYLNQKLFEKFGKRDTWEWTIQEVEFAQEYLNQVEQHLRTVIKDTLKRS